MNHCTRLVVLLALVACHSTRASEAEEARAQAKELASNARFERLAQLQKEYDDADQAYFALVKDMTKAQREEFARANKPPDKQPYLLRAQALLDEDPTDATAWNTIAWMLSTGDRNCDVKPALAALEKYHLQNHLIASLTFWLGRGVPTRARCSSGCPRPARTPACAARRCTPWPRPPRTRMSPRSSTSAW
jgi:hypothetical protein